MRIRNPVPPARTMVMRSASVDLIHRRRIDRTDHTPDTRPDPAHEACIRSSRKRTHRSANRDSNAPHRRHTASEVRTTRRPYPPRPTAPISLGCAVGFVVSARYDSVPLTSRWGRFWCPESACPADGSCPTLISKFAGRRVGPHQVTGSPIGASHLGSRVPSSRVLGAPGLSIRCTGRARLARVGTIRAPAERSSQRPKQCVRESRQRSSP